MEIDVYDLFQKNPSLVVFSAIGLGYLIGKFSIGGFELGSTGGVLLVGLLFGHFAFDSHPFLGTAGGLLLSGIVFGYLRASYPTFGRVPPAARYILMELGLMLFMVNIGLDAGGRVVETLLAVGPTLVLCGVLVLILPVTIGYLFGGYVLKLNPVLLLGSLTGAMTSTPALSVVQDTAKSSMPALGYAGTYAFANVLLTMAGTLLMIL